MDTQEFEMIFEDQMNRCVDTLIEKAKEYATEDRMHNFKVSAALNGQTPPQALWGFQTKHLVSLADAIASGEPYSEAFWNEKIGDALNYLFLLRACVTEGYLTGESRKVVALDPSEGTPYVAPGSPTPHKIDDIIKANHEVAENFKNTEGK